MEKYIVRTNPQKKGQVYPNVLFTMTIERAFKRYAWYSSTCSVVYAQEGMDVKYYKYLDEETNRQVDKLKKKIAKLNKEITDIVHKNQGKFKSMTIEDLKRLKIKGV